MFGKIITKSNWKKFLLSETTLQRYSEGYSENIQQSNRRTPMPNGDFNIIAFQLYTEITWVFSSKFAAYFENTFT